MLDSPATTSSSPFFGTVGVVVDIRFLSPLLVFLLTCIEMLPDRAGCAFTAVGSPAQQPTFIPYPCRPFQRAAGRAAVPLSAARPGLLPVPSIYNTGRSHAHHLRHRPAPPHRPGRRLRRGLRRRH